MPETLTVNFNNAQEYDIDATGYDTVQLNDITKTNFETVVYSERYKIADMPNGEKVLRLTVNTDGAGNYKYINLHNFYGITTITTNHTTPSECKSYDLSGPGGGGVSNMSNPITGANGNNLVGTYYHDLINASDVQQVMGARVVKNKKGKKTTVWDVPTGIGATIDAGAGNDSIIGSQYNDNITGGKGSNSIYLNNTTPFGDDVYHMTEGENLVFWMTTAGPQPELSKNGQDLIITVKNSEGNVTGTVTVPEFFTKNITQSFQIKSSDGTSWVMNVKTEDFSAYTNFDLAGKSGSFQGTYLADTFHAENATQVMGARVVKNKKGKKTTVWDVPTGQGVTIDAGDGNNDITGSNYNDTLICGDGNDIIRGGDGNDTIIAGNGNDVIYAGAGDDIINPGLCYSAQDTIYFDENFGNDTVILTAQTHDPVNEYVWLDFTNIAGITSTADFTYTTEGSDIIVFAKDQGTVRLKDFAKSSIEDVRIRYYDGSSNKAFFLNNESIKGKITSVNYAGSRFDDVINASDAPQVMGARTYKNKKGKKVTAYDVPTGIGVTIDAGEGSDSITGSAYNDTITGGNGSNTVWINTNKSLGDDKYYFTRGESLNIKFTDDSLTGNYNFELIGKDLKLTVYSDNEKENSIGSLTIVGYGNDDFAGSVVVKGVGGAGVAIPSFNKTEGTKTNLIGDNRYYEGSRYVDYVDASGVTQVMGARTYKNKKGKKVTAYDVPTGIGATITGGKGNDTIIGSNYNDTIDAGADNDKIYAGAGNDTITGGTGNNTIYFEPGFGDDTIYLTDGEDLTIDLSAILPDVLDSYQDYISSSVTNGILKLAVYNGDNELQGTIAFANRNDVTPGSINVKYATSQSAVSLDTVATYYTFVLSGQNREFTSYNLNSDIDEAVYAKNVEQVMGARTYKNKKGKKVTAYDVPTGIGANINTGSGDDTIYTSRYNDTITAGDGQNTIIFDQPFGTDTIYLTNGEDLILDITAFGYEEGDLSDALSFSIESEKMSMKVGDKGTITFANLGETGINSGTCSLSLKYKADEAAKDLFDLENELLKYYHRDLGAQERTYIGTSLNEEINATGVQQEMGPRTYKNKKKKWVTVYDQPTGKGINVHMGDGADSVTGSDYSDTIYGEDGDDYIDGRGGDDFIYTGAGDDFVTFGNGDGIDTIYSGSGTDTIYFRDATSLIGTSSELMFATNGKDLIIQYTDNDKVILDNYFTTDHSVKKIAKLGTTANLSTVLNNYMDNHGGILFYDKDGNAVLKKLSADENRPVLDNNKSYYIDAKNVDAGNGKDIRIRLQNSTEDITYIGRNGNTIYDDDSVWTGSGNDTIYTYNGKDSIYAGEGNNRIIINNTDTRQKEMGSKGHDTVEIKTDAPNLHIFHDIDQDDIEHAWNYDKDGYISKIGNDLILTNNANSSTAIKDYFTLTAAQQNGIFIRDYNDEDEENLATLTDLTGGYKVPINVMWSTNSNTEKLDTIANTNINFWTNPDIARANNSFVINDLSLQTNSNKDATYNMHIQNGGVVSLYKGTYNLDVAGTTKVQFDTSSANNRNDIINMNLAENSETKLMLSNSKEWVIVTSDDVNTAKIEIHSTNHAYDLRFYKVSSTGTDDVTGALGLPCSTNDLIIHSHTSDYAQFSGGAVILKDYFLANDGEGYNFGIHSDTVNITMEDDGNPLWNMGYAYRLNVIPDEAEGDFGNTDYTFIANSTFDEYIDGNQVQMEDDIFYKEKANGKHIGWDTFMGTTDSEEYEFDFPEWGGLAIIDDAGGANDLLTINYSHNNMQFFMDVNEYGTIGDLYFVNDNYNYMLDNGGDINDKAIIISGYGAAANRIETIKDDSNYTINLTALDTLAYEISGWLGGAGRTYADTAEVFAGGDETEIAELMQMYAQADVWNPPA